MNDISMITERRMKTSNFRSKFPAIIITIILLLLALAVVLPLLLPWFFVFKTRLEFAYHPWSLPTQISAQYHRQQWLVISLPVTGAK